LRRLEKPAAPRAIEEAPHDLAKVVDPAGLGAGRAGDINGGEGRAVFQKPVVSPRIKEGPHDPAGVVDPKGLATESAGDINRGEGHAVLEKPMGLRGIEFPNDLASVVDPARPGARCRAGNINASE